MQDLVRSIRNLHCAVDIRLCETMDSSSTIAQERKEQPQHTKGSSGNSGTDSEGSGSILSKTSTVAAAHQTHPSNAAEDADKGKGEGAVFRDLKRPASSEACRDSGAVDMHQDIKEHILRLSRDNKQLKSALMKSQEEVKKMKSIIEMHEIQTKKSTKEDKSQSRYWCDSEHQRFLDALQARFLLIKNVAPPSCAFL